ncbi:ferritin [Arthrobacter sp. MYb211]|uniref:ferritin n=1 Tax=Micrococcaceae TaxID=1268 RepID=UPI000BB8E060|nr:MULTISPECIES: ferritin [Micrococcaceae]PCC28443.1 ferritin [Glutamicibacter sp. BW80]PQZ96874.1 ferritin [Arthrobacter sp. MYb224]PQZ97994.1 ferritin [Arthrobacter sp. MYb229]PRA10077.1 ferritin [Arthrobacter sp. MYb221]PRB46876.1 ferritin [Arthrobacter sp. MYb216]
MELTGKLAEAFNTQLTLELTAATVYRQLAVEMDVMSLSGIAGWFRAQAAEEVVHAEKFMTHMTDRDARPKIGEQPAPVMNVKTVVDAFTVSLSHERKVSEAIRELYRLAQTEGDIDSIPMLNWFIEEQVEEEATVSEILDRLKLVGDDGSGILRLDRELGARTSAGE